MSSSGNNGTSSKLSSRPRSGKKREAKNLGNYLIIKHPKLGRGSFADVFLGYRKKDQSKVAVKVINRSKLNDKLMDSLQFEISTLRRIKQKNIIQMYDVHRSKANYYLFMEYCAGGDLATYIKAIKKGPLGEKVSRNFLSDITEGLKCLWEEKIIHRDLKPQNLLLTQKTDFATVKIADFGFAREVTQNDLAETLCGSPLYMAPEILNGKKYDGKADLWSVGAILYEMVYGKPPYIASSIVHLMKVIKEKPISYPAGFCGPQCIDLMKRLLQPDPKKRISFDDYFNHPFLKEDASPLPIPPNVLKPSKPIEKTTEPFKTQPAQNPDFPPKTAPFSSKTSPSTDGGRPQRKPTTNPFDDPRPKQASLLDAPRQSKTNPFKEPVKAVSSQATKKIMEVDPVEPKGAKDLVGITQSGVIAYPEIFDFSGLPCQKNHMEFIEFVEARSQRGWVIAEYAYLKANSKYFVDAILLYTKAIEQLLKTYEIIQKKGITGQSDRLMALVQWIKEKGGDFLKRSDRLRAHVRQHSNRKIEQAPEELLYTYVLKLAKEAGFREYLSSASPQCLSMYKRCKLVLEYLQDRNLNQHDKNIINNLELQIQNRIHHFQLPTE